MERIFIAGLLATNLATGLAAFYHYDMHKLATANQTTDRERETYGSECIKWLNERVKKHEIELQLGRSWRKHGQMVFETIPAADKDYEKLREKLDVTDASSILCSYDKQSGMMRWISGPEKKEWVFY